MKNFKMKRNVVIPIFYVSQLETRVHFRMPSDSCLHNKTSKEAKQFSYSGKKLKKNNKKFSAFESYFPNILLYFWKINKCLYIFYINAIIKC